MASTLYILYVYIKTAYLVLVINSIKTHRLIKELERHLLTHNRKLDDYTTRRIRFYTKQSALTNIWFSTLRGYIPTKSERELGLYIGALTPLADDLTDDFNLSSEVILNKVSKLNATSSNQLILLKYLDEKIRTFENIHLAEALNDAMISQNNSIMQQEAAKLDDQRIIELSKAKGGSATYLYRCILSNPLQENEKDATYSLGYVLQLTNDLFDIHKDFAARQQTLFTNTVDIKSTIEDYKSSISNCANSYLSLKVPKRQIIQFLAFTSVVFARGLVGAHQLEKLYMQKKHWNLGEIDRKDLVIDMEKMDSILLSINYSIQFYKLVIKSQANKMVSLNS